MNGGSLRPRPGEDPAAWTRDVFARGDYAGAAMFGAPATWQYHAARALLRGDEASFSALREFDDAEARLHLGAARWIHGDTAAARRILEAVPLPHAQQLVRLLDQPCIRVLSQLPWLANTPTDLLGGAAHDPAFEVRNVGYHQGDLQNHPYAQVARFLDDGFAPDFFLAAMVEWQHVPPDLRSLPCPIFGHIADHDLHAQTLLPWLHLYDELCVTDRTEWLDVQGLCGAVVSSFPKVFGLPGNLPPVPTAARHLDFFVSGTMLDPYHPDKAALLHELLSLPGIDLRVVRGFTGPMAYRALLAASKASFTYVRRPGAMPTRGLEALAMGCAVAVQEESSLRLFVGDEEGLVPYGPHSGTLGAAVQTILADWRRHGPAAARGATRVRAQFAMPSVASQYLRFLTFRAAAPRAERPRLDTGTWCQKRVSVSRTWLPASPVARRRTMQANFRQLGRVLLAQPSAAVLLDMARELLTEFVFYQERGQAGLDEQALYDDAIRLLERCERLFPNALVPRCVRLRAVLHHGDASARMQALQQAFDLVDGGPDGWAVDPADDVMPFDFGSEWFDYRSYLDLVMRAAKGETVPAVAFSRLLLASLAGYVARKTGKPDLHERAAAWAPGLPRYRLDWARALLARRGAADRALAHTLLQELAAGSTEFAAAARLLHELDPDAPIPLALQRIDEDTLDTRRRTPALFDIERRAPAAARRGAPSGGTTETAPQIAVLVAEGGDGRGLAALLTDLAGQANATALELVVAQPGDRGEHAAVLASFRPAFADLRPVPVTRTATFAERLEACRRATTAPLLTIAGDGDRLRADALSLLRDELQQHPGAAIAYGNDGWTPRPLAHFDPSACTALSCWPRFGPHRLAVQQIVGLHPVWRRSLHTQHGGFAAADGGAAELLFWRRALPGHTVRQLHALLVHSLLDAVWRAQRTPDVGALPPLPAVLFATAVREEAESHARLGLLDEPTLIDVRQLDEFYGTALLHGDLPLAARMLRAAIENVPTLLSARLALARLLRATDAPGAAEVLQAARHCDPYRSLTAGLHESPPAASPPAPAEETKPCPMPQPMPLPRR